MTWIKCLFQENFNRYHCSAVFHIKFMKLRYTTTLLLRMEEKVYSYCQCSKNLLGCKKNCWTFFFNFSYNEDISFYDSTILLIFSMKNNLKRFQIQNNQKCSNILLMKFFFFFFLQVSVEGLEANNSFCIFTTQAISILYCIDYYRTMLQSSVWWLSYSIWIKKNSFENISKSKLWYYFEK